MAELVYTVRPALVAAFVYTIRLMPIVVPVHTAMSVPMAAAVGVVAALMRTVEPVLVATVVRPVTVSEPVHTTGLMEVATAEHIIRLVVDFAVLRHIVIIVLATD